MDGSLMVIDFHTHIYPEKIAARALSAVAGLLKPSADGTRAGLVAAMRRAGVDRSVALALVGHPANSRGINRWAAEENHGEIRMFGSVHPDEPAPLDTLQFIADAGLYGVKVHPEYQEFRFSEERLFPLWERCIALNLPLLTHAGGDIKFPPPYRGDPAELAALHRRYPELKLILAHFGGYEMWDEVEAELIGLPVYLDLAMVPEGGMDPERLVRLIRRHGARYILFGSDSPWGDPAGGLRYFDALPLTAEERRLILHANAETLLHRP